MALHVYAEKCTHWKIGWGTWTSLYLCSIGHFHRTSATCLFYKRLYSAYHGTSVDSSKCFNNTNSLGLTQRSGGLRLRPFTAGCDCSIPGWGNKIPHPTVPAPRGQNKNKTKKTALRVARGREPLTFLEKYRPHPTFASCAPYWSQRRAEGGCEQKARLIAWAGEYSIRFESRNSLGCGG